MQRRAVMVGQRDDVAWFANLMEKVLRENDHKGGWYGCQMSYLKRRLGQEVKELRKALDEERDDDVVLEAADVANFAMMIACRAYAAARSKRRLREMDRPRRKKKS